MSRIYEALKHATQGRDVSLLADDAQLAPILGAEILTGNGTAWPNLSVPSIKEEQTVSSSVSDSLEQNDLWQTCRKPGWKLDPAYNVFSDGEYFASCAEQFRKLRARLYELREIEPVRTLLVTSTIPAEGKTFVALNLALAITRQHNRRVLLVDGDLRVSKLSACLGAPATPGLTEFLRGAADELSIIQTDAGSGLFFIPGGGAVTNPTELLTTDRFGLLLGRLAPIFDWIIVDAPPVLPVSDANILAGQCSGVIVVVRAGSTGSDAIGTALQELQGKKVLGVVLNRAEQQESYGAYENYGGDRTKRA